MTLRFVARLFTMLALGTSIIRGAQQPSADPNAEADRKIMAEAKANNELMKNLEYLSDMLGPRLTGSETLTRAGRWAEQKFGEYGAGNVHHEPWILGRSWSRGTAEGRIVSPAEHRITIASYGWTAGTAGAVRGTVIYVNAGKPADLEAYRGKLKGAIAILYQPQDLEPPENPILVPYGESILPMNKGNPPMDFRFFAPLYQFLTEQGTAAILVPSDKTHGLLNTFSLGWLAQPTTKGVNLSTVTGESYGIAATPTAYVAWEDYNLIWRLLQHGPVEIELNIQNSSSAKPVEVYNTVAEIKGSEKPDEVVMLGAHLDSWDLGTGATDNGTGSVAVLEAARALAKSGVRPKRTIRFVLFSGEEEFLLGSRAYVNSHKSELAKISAILVHDIGTGRVTSIDLQGDYAARETMDGVMAPLGDLGLLEPSQRSIYASDNNAFDDAGVPGFICLQEVLDYNQTHHSQADTFDRVREPGLVQGAEVLAVWAYNVAQLPELLSRKQVH